MVHSALGWYVVHCVMPHNRGHEIVCEALGTDLAALCCGMMHGLRAPGLDPDDQEGWNSETRGRVHLRVH